MIINQRLDLCEPRGFVCSSLSLDVWSKPSLSLGDRVCITICNASRAGHLCDVDPDVLNRNNRINVRNLATIYIYIYIYIVLIHFDELSGP